MCSRFENKQTGLSIIEILERDNLGKFKLEDKEELKKTNIAPTNNILTVTRNEELFILKGFKWGIQFDKEKKSPIIFNSRIETIKEKNYWKNLFYKNRCLIPATAFYEWKEINRVKIPHRIYLQEEKFFFMPALYTKIDGETCASIITTTPNEFMKGIHNRMPVLMNIDTGIGFLKETPAQALDYCIPYSEKEKMSVEYAEELLTEKQRDVLRI